MAHDFNYSVLLYQDVPHWYCMSMNVLIVNIYLANISVDVGLENS
jgi:hypothetical protein